MNELIEIVKYFAQFPDRAGVLKNFSKSNSIFSEYLELKNYIDALPAAQMPAIKDFIFTDSDEELSDRIKNIKSYFMLIEWGPIVVNDPEPSARNRYGNWHFAVNIAHPTNDKGFDKMEYMILSSKTLEYLMQLCNLITANDEEICDGRRYMESAINIAPIDPYLFSGCIGWSLSFQKNFNNKF
jgi:hypothetical protein